MAGWEEDLNESIKQRERKEIHEKQVLTEFFSNARTAFEGIKSKLNSPYWGFVVDEAEPNKKIGLVVSKDGKFEFIYILEVKTSPQMGYRIKVCYLRNGELVGSYSVHSNKEVGYPVSPLGKAVSVDYLRGSVSQIFKNPANALRGWGVWKHEFPIDFEFIRKGVQSEESERRNMQQKNNSTIQNPANKTLDITVGIKEEDQPNFNWNKLKDVLKTNYSGEFLEEVKINKDLFSLTWSQSDVDKVLASAKNGGFAKYIASAGKGTLIEITDDKECIYQFIPKTDFKDLDLESIGVSETKEIKQSISILIVTVNEWEKKAVLELMEPWPTRKKILQGFLTKHTYNFGKFGNYKAAHVEVEMGTGERHGIQNVLRTAVEELKPKVVLLLGLAFGFDNKKYRFGDVLIARTIQPCEYGKLESSGDTSYRGIPKECGPILADRLKAHSQTWTHNWIEGIKGKKVQTHQGFVLSGEKVIDNKEFRDKLYESFKSFRPIGGEMEGGAAYSLIGYIDTTIEIILIKGIGDWADGNKNDDAQPFAAYTAVSLAKYVLSKPDVIDCLINP